MSIQRPTTSTVPGDIESPRAKLVYLYLDTASAATIDDMQAALDLQKITLYSILRTLREREIVEKRNGRFAVVER